MSAYFGFPARPLGFAADASALRALPLDQVKAGQQVQLLAAGALQFWIVRWDSAETAADDGQRYFTPASIVEPAPGRWVAMAATDSLPNTLVLRDGSGNAVDSIAAPLTLQETTTASGTAPDLLILEHHVDPGNGAAGNGAGIAFMAENAGGTLTFAAQIAASLTVAGAGESSKIDFSASTGGLYGVRVSIDGADLKVPGGSLLIGGRLDRLTAVPLQVGGTASSLAFAAATGVATWSRGGSLVRTDTLQLGASGPAWEAGVTGIDESWAQNAIGAGGKWTRTGQRGLAGNVGGVLSFVTGLGGTPGTDLAGSFDVDLGQVVSQATAQLRLLSAGAQFAALRAISGQLLSIEAIAASASQGGLSLSTPALLQFLLLDDQKVTWKWGASQITEWRRKKVTTVNNTPDTSVTFSIPSSASGTVTILVTAVDQTNGERASVLRRYSFSRHNGAASVFSAIGADIEFEVDAAWDVSCTHTSPTITLSLRGDAANQTQFDAQFIVDYQTFSPV